MSGWETAAWSLLAGGCVLATALGLAYGDARKWRATAKERLAQVRDLEAQRADLQHDLRGQYGDAEVRAEGRVRLSLGERLGFYHIARDLSRGPR